MRPFVIYTYDYSPGVGGIKVMHKLCDMLNANGAEAYLMPIHVNDDFHVCSDYNTPLITQEVYDNIENAIVIYPEGIQGNPLNSKNVVRWILGPSRTSDAETYSKTDLIYWYIDYYYTEFLGQRENQLHITEFHSDIFKNVGYNRIGSCYTIRKAKPSESDLIHPEDSIFIPFYPAVVGDLGGLADLFNKTKKFYCYDNYTFLPIQAAMCGCISIVIPDGLKTKEEWLNGSRLHKYGIAYGEDDIDRAIETLPLLFQEIEQTKLEMNENVIKFIEHCNNYFK
jgi:hypothetical protein